MSEIGYLIDPTKVDMSIRVELGRDSIPQDAIIVRGTLTTDTGSYFYDNRFDINDTITDNTIQICRMESHATIIDGMMEKLNK